jgi:hypothetical protein
MMAIAQKGNHELVLVSPDKKLQLTINEAADGNIYYSFRADGVLLIDQSGMGRDTAVKTE